MSCPSSPCGRVSVEAAGLFPALLAATGRPSRGPQLRCSLRPSAAPSLHRRYPVSSLLWAAPTSPWAGRALRLGRLGPPLDRRVHPRSSHPLTPASADAFRPRRPRRGVDRAPGRCGLSRSSQGLPSPGPGSLRRDAQRLGSTVCFSRGSLDGVHLRYGRHRLPSAARHLPSRGRGSRAFASERLNCSDERFSFHGCLGFGIARASRFPAVPDGRRASRS